MCDDGLSRISSAALYQVTSYEYDGTFLFFMDLDENGFSPGPVQLCHRSINKIPQGLLKRYCQERRYLQIVQ